jgi:hypothetical protein
MLPFDYATTHTKNRKIILMILPLIMTLISFSTINMLATEDARPRPRVSFGHVLNPTEFPYLYKPYLPDQIAESKKVTGTYSETVKLCFSPTGTSGSKHQLVLMTNELYLLAIRDTKKSQMLHIDPCTGNTTEMPDTIIKRLRNSSAHTQSRIEYFNDITYFQQLNALMHNIARIFEDATHHEKTYVTMTLSGHMYRITRGRASRFYITPHNDKPARVSSEEPIALVHFLLCNWVLNPKAITVENVTATAGIILPSTATGCGCSIS